MSVEVVVPIGCGDPSLDIPKIDMIKKGLESIKQQTMKVKLTVAMDVNLPIKKQDIIRSIANNVVEFPQHSYFRRGGIWEKIYSCWEKSDCEYVAWNGYDDRHTKDRFYHQEKRLKETGANSCFCPNYHIVNESRMKRVNNGNINFKNHVGNHAEFMGAFLLRKSAILSSGISKYREKWSYYFEGLLYLHIIQMGMPVVSKYGGFIYHWHNGTIAKTVSEEKEWVKEARMLSNYSLSETIKDWNEINFNKLCENLKSKL